MLAQGWLPLPAAAADSPEAATPACAGLTPGPARTVVRIIDGETVGLDDGSEVRLIGALAPRAIDVGAEPGTWPWEGKARDALQALVLGKSVELGFGGERLDRYGRLQAQVYLIEGDQRRWLQGHLLAQGLARAYTLAGNRACADELLAAEQAAREARRGLWAEAAYQVRQADRPAELLALPDHIPDRRRPDRAGGVRPRRHPPELRSQLATGVLGLAAQRRSRLAWRCSPAIPKPWKAATCACAAGSTGRDRSRHRSFERRPASRWSLSRTSRLLQADKR